MEREPLTYGDAGVSLSAADAVVEAIRPHAQRTARPEVIGGIGGFSGLFRFDARRWRRPVLVTSCDGVGTKLEIARRLGRFDSIGRDLVAMVVDDLVTCGAEPLMLTDYIATGRLDVATVEAIVAGIADGCVEVGCALVGGETAEHPGTLDATQLDVAGFGVGVVDRDRVLGPERVEAGDDLVAMASTGLHSNGYSLARRALGDLDLDDDHGLMVQTLGEALLRPTRIYAPHCLSLARAVEVHALCHVTGGGLAANLARVLPDGVGAVVDVSTVSVPGVFRLIADAGPVEPDEMWRTFNMGVGMVAVTPKGSVAVQHLRRTGVDAWVFGRVEPDRRGVTVLGRA